MYSVASAVLVLALAVFCSAIRLENSWEEDERNEIKVTIENAANPQEQINDLLTNSFTKTTTLWPKSADGMVRIYYKAAGEPLKENLLKNAFIAWEEKTCLRFVPMEANSKRTNSFMNIFKGKSCYSYFGPMRSKGTNVSVGCGQKGYIHELGHALGLQHEINRGDRDKMVTVLDENIKGSTFVKKDTYNFDTDLDFRSVMMHHCRAWSKNGQVTILPKDPRWLDNIGGGQTPSFMNLKVMNRAYKCDKVFLDKCKLTTDPCKNRGYMGPGCKCICPPGSEGKNCEIFKMSYNDALLKQLWPMNEEHRKPGIVTTPGYPDYLRRKQNMVYSFIAPKCNRVVLTFLEDSGMNPRYKDGKCRYVWAIIQNGAADTDPKTVCGFELKKGSVIKSKSNDYYIHYHTDGGPHKGLKMSWKYEPIPGCT